MWQDDAERRERTKVVPIEPGSYIVSPASKVRAVMRCTHAIHFAGGIERLKRHETMTVLLKILVRTSFALTANLGWGYAGGGPSVSPYRAKLRPRERIHVSTYHVTHGRVEHKRSSVYNGGWELA